MLIMMAKDWGTSEKLGEKERKSRKR